MANANARRVPDCSDDPQDGLTQPLLENVMTTLERLESMLCLVVDVRLALDMNDADRKAHYGTRGPKLLTNRLEDDINVLIDQHQS
ncbi:MAG: hypothetical protein QQN63_08195 [Nitrosopumilus sp.]